jgi:hypothetical protein
LGRAPRPAGFELTELSGTLSSVRFARVALLLGAFAVAACGGESGSETTSSSTTAREAARSTPSSSTTTSSEPEAEIGEAEIVAAYETAWRDYVRAGDPPDPGAAFLADHHTGASLDVVRRQLSVFSAEGVVLQGEYRPGAEVIEIDGDSARLRDCAVDALKLVNPATGAVVEESTGGEVGALVGMVLEDGAWKLATYERDEGACS